jgi:hypothetical protein
LEDDDYVGNADYNDYLDTTDYQEGDENSLGNVIHMRICQKLWKTYLVGKRLEPTSDERGSSGMIEIDRSCGRPG